MPHFPLSSSRRDAQYAATHNLRSSLPTPHPQLPATSPGWPNPATLDVSGHQQSILTEAISKPLGILTGGPGTGKTYAAARVIGSLIDNHGTHAVAVAAPTGKAAVRITEAMSGYGITIRAKTIHSLLRVASRSEGDGWGFEHDEENPLPYKYVVIDESSMIDCPLAAALFRACGAGTHVLLVGDPCQLPPVGHGAPLRDLIAAGVPTGELTEIRRNSGMIVHACHAIRQGKRFSVCDRLNPETGENLKLLGAGDGEAAIDRVVNALRFLGKQRRADPVWGCQVVVAVNARSSLSRASVNKRLQTELNPNGEKTAGNPFRVGDKIVCLENGFYPVIQGVPSEFNADASDGKVTVANGEQAAVKHVAAGQTIAQLDSPARLPRIPRFGNGDEAGTGCNWDLAYAISCHKSQGSEWPVVFVMLDEYAGARMVCSREWLYTAISRAKTACLLVGKLPVAYGMIGREAIRKRKTFLVERIKDEDGRKQEPLIDAKTRE